MTDYVALYLPGPSPAVKWVNAQPGVHSCSVEHDAERRPARYNIQFLDRTIVINVMKENQRPEHLSGFSNFVLKLHQERPNDNTIPVMERIAASKSILGCAISPGLDPEGLVGGFLTTLAREHDGLIFARDSVFDSGGHPIIGRSSVDTLA